ncbi:MAG: UMP kinase [Candidatus Eremiobacterota bacterium]
METPVYRRILLKISGEFLAGEREFGLAPERLNFVCDEIKSIRDMGVEVAVVVGGGNIWRGEKAAEELSMERTSADQIGMLGTVINGLALQNVLEKKGMEARVQTAINMQGIAEPYIKRQAVKHLEKGRIVIFTAGTGNPYFTTDTAATLRGLEIEADALLKATKVDGVYDKDPVLYPDARKFSELQYIDALVNRLKVMDGAAFSLCMDNKLPVIVFNIGEPGNLMKIIRGEKIGTKVKDK